MHSFGKMLEAYAAENPSFALFWDAWPTILILIAALFGMSFFLKGRKRLRQERLAGGYGETAGIGLGLSDDDLAAYNVEGTAPAAPKPVSPSMDDFFSNSERRAEIGGEAQPVPTDYQTKVEAEYIHQQLGVRIGDEPSADEARHIQQGVAVLERSMDELRSAASSEPEYPQPIFDIPRLEDLPAPEEGEPAPTVEATDRVVDFLRPVEEARKADPTRRLSQLEKIARFAFDCQMMSLLTWDLKRGADPKKMDRYAKTAEFMGAYDLSAILNLCRDLIREVSNPEIQSWHEDDERWYDYVETGQQLSDLFHIANKTNRSAGRMTALADELIQENT